jgi:DNA-binding NarL/FixJ family response regulator
MSFEESFKRSKPLVLTSTERSKLAILVVDPEVNIRQALRQSLIGLAYGTVSDAGDYAQALQKIEDRHFTHLIFDARTSKLPPKEFLKRAFDLDFNMVAIATSYEPTVDDVFDLLVSGARGYIVKPFTTESLDETLIVATKGEPISDAVLNAKNRNEALAALTMSSLDKLATIVRQAKHFETAKREIPARLLAFKRAVDLAKTFCQGGSLLFRETFIDLCIERSQGPASKIGRIRRRKDNLVKGPRLSTVQLFSEQENEEELQQLPAE